MFLLNLVSQSKERSRFEHFVASLRFHALNLASFFISFSYFLAFQTVSCILNSITSMLALGTYDIVFCMSLEQSFSLSF